MTKLIYLIAKAGTGKYTIAKEIAKENYIICDSQLINNPIFALVGYDGHMEVSERAFAATEKIRDVVLDFISEEYTKNYIFTNWLGGSEIPHDEDDTSSTYNRVRACAVKRGSMFIPVRLFVSLEENARRIQNQERKERYKSLSLEEDHNKPLINIIHPNLFDLDITNLSAKEAAMKILKFVSKL